MCIEVDWVTLGVPNGECFIGAPWRTSVKEPWRGLGDAPVSTKYVRDFFILAMQWFLLASALILFGKCSIDAPWCINVKGFYRVLLLRWLQEL